jgi:hypothetical protein
MSRTSSLVKQWRVRYTWECQEYVSQPHPDRSEALKAAGHIKGTVEPIWVWT